MTLKKEKSYFLNDPGEAMQYSALYTPYSHTKHIDRCIFGRYARIRSSVRNLYI
jgi:hypothetical protein